MIIATVALGVVATMFGCASTCGDIKTTPIKSDNTSFHVEKLGSVDGCTVYRFYDEGAAQHFFTKCAEAVSTTTSQTIGKSGLDETITTTGSSVISSSNVGGITINGKKYPTGKGIHINNHGTGTPVTVTGADINGDITIDNN